MIKQIKFSLLRILGLTKKEFITILLDRGSAIVLIVPIIVQCIIFGYGASFDLRHVPYVYFDAAQTKSSNDIIFEISNTPIFELKKVCASVSCVEESIDREEALVGIIIDNDFKHTQEINLILDARHTASANSALSYVSSIVSTYNEKLKDYSNVKVGPKVISRYFFNPNHNTQYSILTAMILTLSVIQVLMLSSLSISREREEGTYDMMMMTPTLPFEILIGKAIPTVFIAIVQSLISYLIISNWFEIALQGSFTLFLFSIFCFSLSVVGLGMMISVFAKNPMQSMITSFLCIMPMVMCSGMLTSVDAMPEWFKIVVYCDPLYYGLCILWRVYLEGLTFADLWMYYIPLVFMGIVSMTLCTVLFRRKLE